MNRKIPEDLTAKLLHNYQYACVPVEKLPNFTNTGRRDNYFFQTTNTTVVSSEVLVKRQLETAKAADLPLQVLDLGTGYGTVPRYLNAKFPGQVQACGVTAHNSVPPNENIYYGNIEFLEIIPELKGKQFNLVFASNVMIHISDQLKVIEKIYELLKDGGVFAIFSLVLRGLEQHLEQLISFLREKGYILLSPLPPYPPDENHDVVLPSLIMLKTRLLPELKLPLDYQAITPWGRKYRICYTPNEEFKTWLSQHQKEAIAVKALQAHSLVVSPRIQSLRIPPTKLEDRWITLIEQTLGEEWANATNQRNWVIVNRNGVEFASCKEINLTDSSAQKLIEKIQIKQIHAEFKDNTLLINLNELRQMRLATCMLSNP